MMRSLWISKTGMEAQQMQLDNISNNLANVSTNGYKRSHAVFEDLMYQNMRQAGAASSDQTELPTGLQVGLGTRAVATARVPRPTCRPVGRSVWSLLAAPAWRRFWYIRSSNTARERL